MTRRRPDRTACSVRPLCSDDDWPNTEQPAGPPDRHPAETIPGPQWDRAWGPLGLRVSQPFSTVEHMFDRTLSDDAVLAGAVSAGAGSDDAGSDDAVPDGGVFGVVGLGDSCGKAAGADASLASDTELLEAAAGLERARSLLDSAQGHVLAELEHRGVCDRDFGHTTAVWLANGTNSARHACRVRVKDARRASGWFALLDEAASAGRVTAGHVGLLCRVANPRNRDALSEAQQRLIDLAREFSFDHWATLVRRLAADLDQDGGYDPNEDLHANRLRLAANGDHTIELTGRLVGDARCTVDQTLATVADELFARFRSDKSADPELDTPSRSTLLALALAEVCRRAGAVDITSSQSPRTEAVIVIEEVQDPIRDACAGGEDSRTVLRSPSGDMLPGSAAVLLADAVIQPLVVDADRNPLRLGRTRRLASPAQRAALAVRDGGCIFPGCDIPPGWCDVHHQPPWDNGGSTDTDSMALLCRHHHGVTQRNRWQMEPHPEHPERWQWSTPAGHTVNSQRHPQRRSR